LRDGESETGPLNTILEDIALTDIERDSFLRHIIELKDFRLKMHMDDISQNTLFERKLQILSDLNNQQLNVLERLSSDRGILKFCQKYKSGKNFNVKYIQDPMVKAYIKGLDSVKSVPDDVGMWAKFHKQENSGKKVGKGLDILFKDEKIRRGFEILRENSSIAMDLGTVAGGTFLINRVLTKYNETIFPQSEFIRLSSNVKE
jgi:hypothetical protein